MQRPQQTAVWTSSPGCTNSNINCAWKLRELHRYKATQLHLEATQTAYIYIYIYINTNMKWIWKLHKTAQTAPAGYTNCINIKATQLYLEATQTAYNCIWRLYTHCLQIEWTVLSQCPPIYIYIYIDTHTHTHTHYKYLMEEKLYENVLHHTTMFLLWICMWQDTVPYETKVEKRQIGPCFKFCTLVIEKIMCWQTFHYLLHQSISSSF